MSTLKAFKAAIKVGMQIRVTDHWVERWRGSVRTVVAVQGNGYWFKHLGERDRCWAEFPKASQLQFDGTTAQVTLDERRHWTLDFTTEGAAARQET